MNRDEWRRRAEAELDGEISGDDDGKQVPPDEGPPPPGDDDAPSGHRSRHSGGGAPGAGPGPGPVGPDDDAWGRGRGAADDDPAKGAAALSWLSPGADWLDEAPPEREYLLYEGGNGATVYNGLLPKGKVAILAAAGGAGKTFALVGLALSVVTGRPWLGRFPTGPKLARRVVLVLGEEERDELRRRLWTQAGAMGLDGRHADAVGRILALPGAGLSTLALTQPEDREVGAETLFSLSLFAHLEAEAERNGEGWDAVILDPLSRFAGPDVETDNSAATRLVQVLEGLCKLPGSPAVIVAHHTTKASRKADGEGAATTAVRGASGLTDGARWVAGLDPVDRPSEAPPNLPAFARFRVTKTNYGRFPTLPDDGALLLARADGGGLREATDAERAALAALTTEAAKPPKASSTTKAAPRPAVDLAAVERGRAAVAAAVERLASAPKPAGKVSPELAAEVDRGLLDALADLAALASAKPDEWGGDVRNLERVGGFGKHAGRIAADVRARVAALEGGE